MNYISEAPRNTPVVYECDICVIGGSCTGVFAAVRAARLGVRVAIIEQMGFFGGVATAALVNIWHSLKDFNFKEQIIGGLTSEVIERLKKRNGISFVEKNHHVAYYLNTEELKIELDELVNENKIRTFFHAKFVSPHMNNDHLDAIIIEDKSGRRCIKASVFIDASGDADLVNRIDQNYTYKAETIQPPTLCARLQGINKMKEIHPDLNLSKVVFDTKYPEHLKKGFLWGGIVPGSVDTTLIAGTRGHGIDVSDADQLTKGEFQGREQVRKICDLLRNNFEGGKSISVAALATYIGGRESRHLNSLYQLKGDDVLYGKPFDDAIAYGTYPCDIHSTYGGGIELRYLDGTSKISENGKSVKGNWREIDGTAPAFYQIPFRSLTPKSLPNVLVAGRNLDADAIAFGAVRVMVNCNQMGEAAGVGAYIALTRKIKVQEINCNELIKELQNGGSLLKTPKTNKELLSVKL